jgi:hypothetical protein
LVSTEGCTYIAQFLKEIKKESQLAIPKDSAITLYKTDGKTEIKPTATLQSLEDAGKAGDAPLIVKTTAVSDSQPIPVIEKNDVQVDSGNPVLVAVPSFTDNNGKRISPSSSISSIDSCKALALYTKLFH